MNKAILMGRLTKNPEIKHTQGKQGKDLAIARYTLAVKRWNSKEDEADFINCVAFGRSAEFAEKYLHQGTKILVSGRIQTGSYTNKDGQRVYTTEVIVEEHEFAESRSSSDNNAAPKSSAAPNPQAENNFPPFPPTDDGFMSIPDGIDEELPFQ